MSGFCVAKTEGHPHLCPSDTYTCGKYCKDYERGKIAPTYPVPAIPLVAIINEEEVWICQVMDRVHDEIQLALVDVIP